MTLGDAGGTEPPAHGDQDEPTASTSPDRESVHGRAAAHLGPHPAPTPGAHGAQGEAEQLTHQLFHLERRLAEVLSSIEKTGRVAAANTGRLVPAWRRVTEGEHRWPVTLAVVCMIGLQTLVPDRLVLTGRWVLPVVEVAILAVLVASNPLRVTHTSRQLRVLSLMLIVVASAANAWSAGRLIVGLVNGTEGENASALLATGGNIWLTNIVIFGLWYWDLDRGGPSSRARAEKNKPDFLFPEMTSPELADPDWEPQFVDYLYVAFTNATAFSPTDTMPFSRWSKMAMMLQSSISLITGALVIARAVNILR